MDAIEKYVTPLGDDERSELIRDALAAAALARAAKGGPSREGLEAALERQLEKVSPRALEALTIHASDTGSLRKAIRDAYRAGDLIPQKRDYSDAELEL